MRNPIAIMRLLSLVGLAISSASWTMTRMHSDAFCPLASDCGRVMSSQFGELLGIPIAIFGIAGFGSVLLASLLPKRKAQPLPSALCILAGCAGLALLTVQIAVLRQVCSLCVCADLCGIALLATTIACRRAQPPDPSWLSRIAWLAAAALLGCLPVAWTAVRDLGHKAPDEVRTHWMQGRITVVEVTDFECPHCCRADRILKSALQDFDKVHLVRLPAPMPKYPNSRSAAKAYLAAQRQGKGEEMADALYRAESRSAEECRKLAMTLGLDICEYDQTVNGPAVEAELDATIAWAQRFQRLPQIWVHDRLIARVPSQAELQTALQNAGASSRKQ